MDNYKCKCGNEKDFFIEHNSSQCGLYCGECGKWQKWLNKDEERLFKHKQDLAEHDKQIRDEVISEIENFVNGICEYPPTSLLGKKEILDKLKRMKGEQNA